MKRLRSVCVLSLVVLSCIVGLVDRQLRAAGGSSPTVTITRIAALNRDVIPADVNGDGIADLVGISADVHGNIIGVAIATGKGDGTFDQPVVSDPDPDRVLAVADFNHDGKPDLVTHLNRSLSVLPGNGTVSYYDSLPVGVLDVTDAVAADIDGDGNMDIVAIDGSQVYVFPGHGDCTFGTPVTLTPGAGPNGIAVGDLNGDGKPDIVIANHDAQSVSVFLNQGAISFTASDILFGRLVNDVALTDLNHDRRTDLIVATADADADNPDAYAESFVYVLFGTGNGTFGAAAEYPTAPGAWRIALGDFTRDGVADIATANRSAIYVDDCATSLKTWDSVTILPGNGDGTFATGSSFSLGDQSNLTSNRYRNTVLSLNTWDLNRDGAPDLVASWGVVLKNNPPDPNWAPHVTASATQPSSTDHEVTLSAPATDSDQDMLAFGWSDSAGQAIPPVPLACFSPRTLGVHTFTVTVSDRHGHTASSSVTVDFGSGGGGGGATVTFSAPQAGETVALGQPYTIKWTGPASIASETLSVSYTVDAGAHWNFISECNGATVGAGHCVWNSPGPVSNGQAQIRVVEQGGNPTPVSGTSGTFSIQSPSGALPSPWQHQDIGAVGASGSASYANGVFTVKGSGADIWGAADEFQYVYATADALRAAESFNFTAHVDSVQHVNAWTKAGLMARGSLDANSVQASIFVTPGNGIAFQRRPTTGGSSINTSVASVTAPVWLRLFVHQNQVSAFYKKNATDAWILVGSQTYNPDDPEVTPFEDVGFAVTSHDDGVVATAAFSGESVADAMPPLTFTQIGTSTGSGTVDGMMQTVTMTARGADIWGTSDQFEFGNTQVPGDATSTVLVRTVGDTSPWAKAGLMFRSSVAANAAYVAIYITPGNGVAMQLRTSDGGSSTQTADVSGSAPIFLRLSRSNATFTGAWSSDGVTWHDVGSATVSMAFELLAGLALTSHNLSSMTTAVFADPSIHF